MTKTERLQLRAIKRKIRELSQESLSPEVKIKKTKEERKEFRANRKENKEKRKALRQEKKLAREDRKQQLLQKADSIIENKKPEEIITDISTDKNVFVRFVQRQVMKGIEYEKDLNIKISEARRIALANLKTDPYYYQKLEKQVMGKSDEDFLY